MNEAKIDALIECLSGLADAMRLQTLGLHALADAIAAPVDGEDGEEADQGEPETYMDGTPIE